MYNSESHNRINELLLKENFLLGLSFPAIGSVFYRVLGREFITYKYNEIGDVEADEWKDSARLGLSAKNITDVLNIEDCDMIYQMFMGISPSPLKGYLHYPMESMRGNLESTNNYTKSDFGFIDGFESSFDDMSPKSEVWIPKDMKVGWAWHNPTDRTVRAMLNLMIVRYRVNVIRDADLIHRILTGRKECRIATIGGVGTMEYNVRHVWDINPIPYGATLDEIDSLVRMRKEG
jgi:hypothetical protein